MDTKAFVNGMNVIYRVYETNYFHQNSIDICDHSEFNRKSYPNFIGLLYQSEFNNKLYPNFIDLLDQSEFNKKLYQNYIGLLYQSEFNKKLYPSSIDVLDQSKFNKELDPNFIDLLDQSEITEVFHEKICEQLNTNADPTRVVSVGHTLFIGFDCEWVERAGTLQILSYQFYLVGFGGDIAVVFPADERLTLKAMLNVIMKIAHQTGTILHYSRDIILAGYFLRADLAMLSDFIEFKEELSNISGSVGNAGSPLKLDFSCSADDFNKLDAGGMWSFRENNLSYSSKITFYDLAKHAPEKTPLAVLGELLGIEKITIPNIAEMDKLRKEDFELFIDYGIRDAEIAVKYYLHILEFTKQLLNTQSDLIPATAGSLAVSLCKSTIDDFEEVFGLANTEKKVFDGERNRFVTQKRLEHTNDREFHETFVSKCYHGGMNICYYAGATDIDTFFDYDLSGAYTTGMIIIRPPDYEKSYETTRIKEFLGDVMGFALVHFTFPSKTKYPCLPVKSYSRDGLYYPLEGESHCTAPELALVIRQQKTGQKS